MDIVINNMKIISSWSYHLDKNTDCTICRGSLNSDSIYNMEKGIRSTLSRGLCGHMYHTECIDPWLKNNIKCPICSQNYK